MYSHKKTAKGLASIQEDKGRLRVRFPRELFNGKLKVMSLGLSATPEGYQEANRRLRAIQADIDLGKFDPTLEKYKPQSKKESYIQLVQELHPETDLLTLWEKYYQYKSTHLKPTSLYELKETIGKKLIESKLKSPYQALELREWLLKNGSPSMAKRVLIHCNAAFKFGLQHKLVKGNNPFEGMASHLKHNYELNAKPNAFSESEKARVIAAFSEQTSPVGGQCYCYYTNFVRFLFLTGCRPNEAVGLRWSDVFSDCRKITFNGGVVYKAGRSIRVQGSKNNRKREFPCNQELQNMLKTIKSKKSDNNELVFPSPNGLTINYNNFRRRIWGKLVSPIKPDTTPYSCRDTFITEQITKGIAPAIIAKWVDTSVGMIEKHYLDNDSIAHILPQ